MIWISDKFQSWRTLDEHGSCYPAGFKEVDYDFHDFSL